MIYWLLGRSRTLRVTIRSLQEAAQEKGWRSALAGFARLVLALPEPEPECPQGPACSTRSYCESGVIRCMKHGPLL